MTLTDTGRRSAAAFHAEVTAELTQLLSPLAPHDRERFRAVMAKITQSAGVGSWLGDVPVVLTVAGEQHPLTPYCAWTGAFSTRLVAARPRASDPPAPRARASVACLK